MLRKQLLELKVAVEQFSYSATEDAGGDSVPAYLSGDGAAIRGTDSSTRLWADERGFAQMQARHIKSRLNLVEDRLQNMRDRAVDIQRQLARPDNMWDETIDEAFDEWPDVEDDSPLVPLVDNLMEVCDTIRSQLPGAL